MSAVRPYRGGFGRPFGCGIFIRDFLAGEGPYGSSMIDPGRGAPQVDIKYAYKEALLREVARNRAEKEISDLVLKGVDVTDEMASAIEGKYRGKISSKFVSMRYHSFLSYFGLFKRLGWVEPTGEVEPSSIQENYPDAPPRVYYRLTAKGQAAPAGELLDPVMTLYNYPRDVRSPRTAAVS